MEFEEQPIQLPPSVKVWKQAWKPGGTPQRVPFLRLMVNHLSNIEPYKEERYETWGGARSRRNSVCKASKKLGTRLLLYVGRQALKAVKRIKSVKWNTLRTNSTGYPGSPSKKGVCNPLRMRVIEALGVDQGWLTAHPTFFRAALAQLVRARDL